MHKALTRYHLFIGALLLVSLFIYVFYRTDKIVVNEWLIALFSEESFAAWKHTVGSVMPLPEWIVYSFPEGCWIAAVSLASKHLFISVSSLRISCIFFPLVFSVGLEIAQLLHITKGRFDPMDVVMTFAGWLLAYRFIRCPYEPVYLSRRMDFPTAFMLSNYAILYLSCVNR